MSQLPLKVGVVGAGIGRHHLNGYRALANQVEVVALCDLNEARYPFKRWLCLLSIFFLSF